MHTALRVGLEIWFRAVLPLGLGIVSGVFLVYSVSRMLSSGNDAGGLLHIAIVSGISVLLSLALLIVANLKRFRHQWRDAGLDPTYRDDADPETTTSYHQ